MQVEFGMAWVFHVDSDFKQLFVDLWGLVLFLTYFNVQFIMIVFIFCFQPILLILFCYRQLIQWGWLPIITTNKIISPKMVPGLSEHSFCE